MISYILPRLLLVLIAGAGIAYFLSSDARELKKQNSDLQAKLAGVEKQWVKLRHMQGELAYTGQELAKVEQELSKARGEAARLQRRVEERQLAIGKLERDNEELYMRHRLKVWQSAKGQAYDQITTPQGKVYTKVIITDVRPHEVSFMFGLGAQGHSLGLDQIPDIWIRKFMYTSKEVDAAKAARKVEPKDQPAKKQAE